MTKTQKKQTNYNRKLSRSYKFKKKTGKIKKPVVDNDTEKNQIKKPRIIIRNLSFKITESDIRGLYEPFGEIEEIKLLRRPDGKPVGCGFVQFKNLEDASKAIFKTNKSCFLGRTISSEWAIPKSQFSENLKKEKEEKIKDNTNADEEEVTIEDKSIEKTTDKHKKRNAVSKAEQRKLYKLKKRQKRSRIVIRNLSFAITEDKIKERFGKYGKIEDVRILKKPDGTPTGCCFLQFDHVQSAAQAIHYENLKSFQDRLIVVDWAIPKDKYQTDNENVTVKTEKNEDAEVVLIKEEKNESFDSENIIKSDEESSQDDTKIEISEDDNSEESDRDENQDMDDSDENVDTKKSIKHDDDNDSGISHPRRISNDVREGKTVFIKNVPFSANNEDLKQCMEQFGPIYYALICMDRLTEHSKGTAFVKFRNIEDAEKCLAAGTELKIHDQVLDPHPALHKNEVNEKNAEKQKKVKDSRNLYLVKEGVILASSPAAKDVSASDMARRLQLERWKSQMLRNLNMFVSRVRLVIHNLPNDVDDSKLRQLFKNHSNPKAVITEAKIMRDLKNVDANGIGKSKEYGFVSFSAHEDALKALRSINNHPNIFTKTKRPIVAFSIENRVMVNAKQKRVENSRKHNPMYGKRKQLSEKDEETAKANGAKIAKKEMKKQKNKNLSKSKEADDGVKSFTGMTSKPGMSKMHGKFFLKKQAALHNENLKIQKKNAKSLKRLTKEKKQQAMSRKEAKPKQGSKKADFDEINFSRLVNSYKKKLTSIPNLKSKWYET